MPCVENFESTRTPDVNAIAFICSKGRGEENDVCVMPAAGGAVRNVTSTWALDPSGPAWSPDSKTVYFSAGTPGKIPGFAAPGPGGTVPPSTAGRRQAAGTAATPHR